jgi:hypothetical protein
MKTRRKALQWKVFGLSFFLFPAVVLALSPMDYFTSLVAGSEDSGFQDGTFYQARFNNPCALAMDDKGERLFVADRDNQRIRVVFLNEDNRVETLTGTGQAGSADGPLTLASFDHPSVLAWVPGGLLVVYDAGSQRFREIDLKAQTVSTLACFSPDCKTLPAPSGQVWNMAYRPKDNSLYFTVIGGQDLDRLDLGTQKISTVFSKDPRLPQPKALCIEGDKLYVADRALTTVYEVETDSNASPVSMTEAGTGNLIHEMAFSDGVLYALQQGTTPLARLNPYGPVSLATPWGFTLDGTDNGYNALLSFLPDNPVGLVTCPQYPRKLFISSPKYSDHSLLSVKDFEFDKLWPARDEASDKGTGILTDFHYPEAKAPHTFRILVVGGSQILSGDLKGLVDGTITGKAAPLYQYGASPRVFTWPKQLEFMLNAQSALAHTGTHFEVLDLAHPSLAPQYYGYFEAPPLVEKYHVDLVVFFTTPYNGDNQDAYASYYQNRMTPEGVPNPIVDPEYLLTPASKRVPPGVPTDLYQRATAKGFIKRVSPNQDSFAFFGDLLASGDSQIHHDLVQMVGLPLKLLSDKVHRHKTDDGKETPFLLCYAPSGDGQPKTKSAYDDFWQELAGFYQLPLLDLDDAFRALKPAFYPTNDSCCHGHYTAYGDLLVAYLMNYYLAAGNYIPSATAPAPAVSPK